jgi:adenylate cyclase
MAVAAVAAALAGLAAVGGVLDGVERDLVDARFDVRGVDEPPDDIVVVAIDDSSLGIPWPFPRWVHARAIRHLREAGARLIVYDVAFAERRPPGDRALIAAATGDDVLLAADDIFAPGRPRVIGNGALRAGHAGVFYDDDGTVRRVKRVIEGVPHVAVAASGADTSGPDEWIDFAGPPGTYARIPFWRAAEGRLQRGSVEDKIVIVGATAGSLQDLHPTSAGGGQMPGPEVLANAIDTLRNRAPLQDAPAIVGLLLVLAGAALVPLATLPGPPTRAVLQGLAAGALGLAALLAGAQLAFDAGTVVPVAVPLFALVLGTVGAVALTYGVEVRSRRHTRAAFERFVPPAVVDEILRRGDGRAELEPRRLVATVMFCDLRGFTTLAEGLEAEQVIAVLNRYLETVSSAVFDHGGTVVSYQGDGVLAVFGAPIAQDDHAARALAAARQVLDEGLPALSAWLRDEGLGDGDLDVGIGLNTGPVMSGAVGSRRRVEYAAVGDATNVAARLQALSRDAPERLFASASTVEALGAPADGLQRHGEVALRGRREPVTVFAAR